MEQYIQQLNNIVISDYQKKQLLIKKLKPVDNNFYIVTTGIYDNIYTIWDEIYQNITKYIPLKFNIIVDHYDEPEYMDETRNITSANLKGNLQNKYLTIDDINNYQLKNHIIIDFAHLFLYGENGSKLLHLNMYTNPDKQQGIVYDNLNVVRTSYPIGRKIGATYEKTIEYIIYTQCKLFQVNADGTVITLIDKIIKKNDFDDFYINLTDVNENVIHKNTNITYYYEPLEVIKYLIEKLNHKGETIKIFLENKYATEKKINFFDIKYEDLLTEKIKPVLNVFIECFWGKCHEEPRVNITKIYNMIYPKIKLNNILILHQMFLGESVIKNHV
jgi:hypothetical protein